jgi:hypothetical protein
VLTRPSRLLDRHLPLLRGQSFHPRHQRPIDESPFTRHQRGFTQFTRPVFPSPTVAGWNAQPLRLSPGLRTPPTKSRQRTPGRGQAIEHGPGTTRSTPHRLILQSVVHSQRATSRRTPTWESLRTVGAARLPELWKSSVGEATDAVVSEASACRNRTPRGVGGVGVRRPRAGLPQPLRGEAAGFVSGGSVAPL